MAYIRKKHIKGHVYYYLVASYRRDGKVKTRTVKYLGKNPAVAPADAGHGATTGSQLSLPLQ